MPIIRAMRSTSLFIILVLTSCPVHAQVDQASIDEASAAFKSGNFDNALRMFRTLRSRAKDPKIRLILQWNIGRCLEKGGQIAQAILVFEDYRKTVNDPVRAARAETMISTLRKDQTGAIAVSCDRSDVSVSVEGMNGSEGSCPRVIESIGVGSYVLIGRRPDDSMSRTIVTVKANETTSIVGDHHAGHGIAASGLRTKRGRRLRRSSPRFSAGSGR